MRTKGEHMGRQIKKSQQKASENKANAAENKTSQKDDVIVFSGTVTEALKDACFRVRLETGHDVLAHVSGKIRKFNIRIIPGDNVTVELSTYDLTRGRILRRL